MPDHVRRSCRVRARSTHPAHRLTNAHRCPRLCVYVCCRLLACALRALPIQKKAEKAKKKAKKAAKAAKAARVAKGNRRRFDRR